MGNLEACARKEAQNELENRYRQQGLDAAAAKLQAQADLNALDGYFQAGQFEPRDRIQFLTGLAVGLASNQITIPEWRKELAAICGIRSRASAGAIGTCDEAFKNNGFGGRAAYMGGGCPTNSGTALASNPCDSKDARLAPKNATLTDRGDRNHLGDWLFGKGGYDMSRNKITGSGVGGQLDSRTQVGISKNAQQAFHDVAMAFDRYCQNLRSPNLNPDRLDSISLTGPGAEVAFGYGAKLTSQITVPINNLPNTSLSVTGAANPLQATTSIGLSGVSVSPPSINFGLGLALYYGGFTANLSNNGSNQINSGALNGGLSLVYFQGGFSIGTKGEFQVQLGAGLGLGAAGSLSITPPKDCKKG